MNFSAEIKDLKGKPIPSGDDPSVPLTLGEMSAIALVTPMQGEEISVLDKRKRVRLADKIIEATTDGTDLHLSPADIALLIELIGKIYNTLLVGRAAELLDPSPDT